MTPQPQQDRCVLTRHDVQSIKDLVFIVGGNSESSAQKAIFEILANNMRRSRPHTSTPNPCEEQGCTDTEQCDEICEHSRIYSPAWVKEHDTAIRNATIVALQEKMCDLYDSGMKNPLATFDAAVFELYNVQSLRTPTQEHP